jgi:precorrin-8X/cobalt-precorrin-8 methylmutase
VPVGFVEAAESKQALYESDIPAIVALGRKGGSNLAAALTNAILYNLNIAE